MLKRDFFIAAMKAGLYKRRAFVISAFTLVDESLRPIKQIPAVASMPKDIAFTPAEHWQTDPYPYRIVQRKTGTFFVSPDNDGELILIEDAKPNQPPLYHRDPITITNEDIPNVEGKIETTYGNLLFNWTTSVHAFGTKLPYLEGRVDISKVEATVVSMLEDTPEPGAVRRQDKIYVDEYLKWAEAVLFMTGYMQVCVPAGSRKSLTAPPGVAEYKAKLLEEYKDRLDDPAVIAEIQAKLIEFDTEYLKGDISEGFLITKKLRNVVRPKLFLMGGAEAGFNTGTKVGLIKNSLSEGLNPEEFPTMANAQRSGSYLRGAETMLGGETFKWLLRASTNMNIVMEDCGSRLGGTWFMTEKNAKRFLGFSVVTPNGHEVLTEDSVKKYVNKIVKIRNPQHCKLGKTDYCSCCVGPRLAVSPTALSSAISELGSIFMLLSMKAMHGKALEVTHMDFKSVLR